VNSDAYDVLSLTVRDVHTNTTAALNNDNNNSSSIDGDDMSLQAKPEWRKHFPLNALLRPSINSTSHNAFHIPNNKRRDTILITELTNQTVVTHQPRIVNAVTGERAMCAVEGVVTVPRNLEVAVLDAGLMEEEENGQDGAGSVGEAVVNIRGGGDGDGGDDVVMEESKRGDVDMSEAPVNNAVEGGTSAGGGVDNNAVIASSNTAATTTAVVAGGGGSDAAVETKPVEAVAPVPSAQSGGEIKEVATQEQQPTTAAVAAATDDKSQVVSSTDVVVQQGGVADVATSSNTTQVATSTAVAAASAPAATAVAAPTAAVATSSSSGVTTTTTTTSTTNQPTTTSAAAPVPTPEATTVKSTTTIHPLPKNHPPLSTSIILPTTTTITTSPQNAPSWYHPTTISTTEKSSLPEWFNSSAPHRTPATYLSTRNQILNIYQAQLSSSNNTTAAASTTTNNTTTTASGGTTTTVQHQQQYLTPTAIRRCVPGDVGSLSRLHSFLCDWGLINGKDLGENAPSDLALRGGSSNKGKRKLEDVQRSVFWSKERLEELDGVVVKYVKVTQTTVIGGGGVEGVPQQQQQQQPSVDWDAVAKDIGDGVSAADCQRAFLDPPPNDEVSVKIAKTSSSSTSGFDLTTILDGVHPDVLQATINASLKATNDITEARKASIAGILASTAATKAHSEEEEIARTLMDILDQRMQRLENRVAILDDVEALLEAERVALELERRDMYTTRCRHWFGDGSS